MTPEQKQEYEADQIMRGMGNKCCRKVCESLVMAAIMMIGLYYSGGLDMILTKWNPEMAQRMRIE